MQHDFLIKKLKEFGVDFNETTVNGLYKIITVNFGNVEGKIEQYDASVDSYTGPHLKLRGVFREKYVEFKEEHYHQVDITSYQEFYDYVKQVVENGSILYLKLEREFEEAKEKHQKIRDKISELMQDLELAVCNEDHAKEKFYAVKRQIKNEQTRKMNEEYEKLKEEFGQEVAIEKLREKYPK
jgi:hypothetical protein